MSFGPSRGRAGFGKCRAWTWVWGGVVDGGVGWVVVWLQREREKWTDVTLSAASASAQNEERQRTAREGRPDGRTYVVVPGHVKGGDAGEGDERERERGGEGTGSEAEHGCRCTTESV